MVCSCACKGMGHGTRFIVMAATCSIAVVFHSSVLHPFGRYCAGCFCKDRAVQLRCDARGLAPRQLQLLERRHEQLDGRHAHKAATPLHGCQVHRRRGRPVASSAQSRKLSSLVPEWSYVGKLFVSHLLNSFLSRLSASRGLTVRLVFAHVCNVPGGRLRHRGCPRVHVAVPCCVS